MRSAEDILKDIVEAIKEGDGGLTALAAEAWRLLNPAPAYPWYEMPGSIHWVVSREEFLQENYDFDEARGLVYADEQPKLVELTEDEILALIPPSSVDVLRADVAGDAAPVHALLLLFARKVIKAHHGEA